MAITVNSQNNMSGINRRAYGALSAADVSVDLPAVITINLGFVPSYVKVMNVVDRIVHEHFFGMAQGDYVEQIAAGDKTVETDDLLSVDPDTGVISITQASNPTVTDGDLLVWEAQG